MSCFKSGKSGRNFGRNFCPNPVNPVPAGFENCKSGASLIRTEKYIAYSRVKKVSLFFLKKVH